jgi:aminobenzoyl-glutamate utilization protein B
VPLAELAVATRPLGSPAHHWAQTATAGHGLGQRGMLVAAQTLYGAILALLSTPELVQKAKREFQNATAQQPYQSPLPASARPESW